MKISTCYQCGRTLPAEAEYCDFCLPDISYSPTSPSSLSMGRQFVKNIFELLAAGEDDIAVSLIDDILIQHKNPPFFLRLLIDNLIKNKKLDEIEQYLVLLEESGEVLPEGITMLKADIQLAGGNLEEASQIYWQYINDYPEANILQQYNVLCVLKKLAIEQKIFGQYLTDLNYKILNLLNSPAFYSKLLSETEKVGDTSEFNLLTGTYVLFHTKKALKEASHLINFIKDIIQDRYSVIRELAQAYYYRANYTPIFQILNYDFATNPGIAFLFGAYIKKREFQSALQLYQKIDLNQINFNQKELKIFAATLVILLDQLLKKNRFQEVEDITRQVIKYLETLKQKQKWEEEFPLDNISDALNNYLAGIYFKRAAQNYTDYNFDQALKIASQASELGSKGGYSLVKKIKRSNLINKWCRVFTSTTLVLAMLYLGMLSFGYQISHGAEGFGRFTGQLFGILSRNISLLPDQEDFDHRRARKKVGMGRFFRTKKKSTTISGNNLEQILPSMSSSFVTDEELDPSQYRVYFIKGDPEFIEDQEERRQKAREELQLCYSHLDKLQEVEEEFTTIMVNLPVDLIKSGMDHIEFDEVPEELKKITRKYPEFIKDNPVRLIASKKRKINRKIQYLESIANY